MHLHPAQDLQGQTIRGVECDGDLTPCPLGEDHHQHCSKWPVKAYCTEPEVLRRKEQNDFWQRTRPGKTRDGDLTP